MADGIICGGISKARAKLALSLKSSFTHVSAIALRFERFHYDRTKTLESHKSLSSGLTSMSLDKTLKAIGLRKKTPADKVREAGASLNARFAKLRGATPESRARDGHYPLSNHSQS